MIGRADDYADRGADDPKEHTSDRCPNAPVARSGSVARLEAVSHNDSTACAECQTPERAFSGVRRLAVPNLDMINIGTSDSGGVPALIGDASLADQITIGDSYSNRVSR
jgi:hypothetical protein